MFCSVLCLVSTQHRHQEHAEHEQRHAPHHHAQPIAAGTSLADSALAIDDETHLIPEALPSELAKRSHSELRRPWPRVLVSQDAIRDLVMESLVQYSAFVDSMCPASVTVNAINDVARFATRRSSHKTRISAAAQRPSLQRQVALLTRVSAPAQAVMSSLTSPRGTDIVPPLLALRLEVVLPAKPTEEEAQAQAEAAAVAQAGAKEPEAEEASQEEPQTQEEPERNRIAFDTDSVSVLFR